MEEVYLVIWHFARVVEQDNDIEFRTMIKAVPKTPNMTGREAIIAVRFSAVEKTFVADGWHAQGDPVALEVSAEIIKRWLQYVPTPANTPPKLHIVEDD